MRKMNSPVSLLLLLLLLCGSTLVTAFRLQLRQAGTNLTMAERLTRAAARTHSRRLASSSSGVAVQLGDDYIVDYDLGMPRQRVQAVVEFTSSLIWLQCINCLPHCFPQDFPYFDYNRSRTGRAVRCDDSECTDGYAYETRRCTGGDHSGMCAVRTVYAPAMDIAGALRIDEFNFFGSEEVNLLSFGCIRETSLTSGQSLGGPSGLIGLGRGALSLVSQVGENRFSYCLTRYDSDHPSPLLIGSSAGLNGNAPVISVPFAVSPRQEPFSSFYYLPLTGMTVGTSRLDIPAEAFRTRRIAPRMWTGGVIPDAGSRYTYLVDVAYAALKEEVTRQLGRSLVTQPANFLELCVARGNIRLPSLVLHFGGDGGDLMLPAENVWAPIGLEYSCLVIMSSVVLGTLPWNESTLIGSYMQQNLNVLFDLDYDSIAFQEADCAAV